MMGFKNANDSENNDHDNICQDNDNITTALDVDREGHENKSIIRDGCDDETRAKTSVQRRLSIRMNWCNTVDLIKESSTLSIILILMVLPITTALKNKKQDSKR